MSCIHTDCPPSVCPSCGTKDTDTPQGVGGWRDREDGTWECACGYIVGVKQ